MDTVTRQGVFETNSSSTHSICVAKEGAYTLPSKMAFVTGEFGWEVSTLRSMDEKASYLYTGLLETDRTDQIAEIEKLLEENGVTAVFVKPGDNEGYVDHAGELTDFLDAVTDKDELFRYLFSDFSYILTGNDNGWEESRNAPDASAYETHNIYEKGN